MVTAVAPDGLSNQTEDFCPVCKSTRNKNLKIKSNRKCYHLICASCVDRIFGFGPNTCPIVGCSQSLRKADFRDRTFEDVAIEREVDIRRDIAATFNKTELDFETLQDYNNYLELVEDISFELVNGINVEQNRAKIDAYKREYGDDSKSRARREANEKIKAKAAQAAAQKEKAKVDRRAAVKDGEQGGKASDQPARNDGDATTEGTAGVIDVDARKKVGGRGRTDGLKAAGPLATSNGSLQGAFVLHGLKRKEEPVEESMESYDPYGGMAYRPQFFVLDRDYDHPEFSTVRKNEKAAAGGWTFQEYYQRALCEAFGGLGVFVAEEMAGKPVSMSMSEAQSAPASDRADARERMRKASKAAKTLASDDVF